MANVTLDKPTQAVQIHAEVLRHHFAVQIRCLARRVRTCFVLPTWLRGSYLIRDFAKHVFDLQASVAGQPCCIERIDKSSFAVNAAIGDEIVLRYKVFAADDSVRKAYLDDRRGFFNASSLVYCAVGFEREPIDVELLAPAEIETLAWQVATALPAIQIDARGFGHYRAAHYEALLDAPVEMAAFQRLDFSVRGIAHTLTLSNRAPHDSERLVADLQRICAVQREFFADSPSMERYWFLVNVSANGYGGLEHRESTALICSRNDLPQIGESGLKKSYRNFLGLVSHEYFHLWNVKRITPQKFAESNLTAPGYSEDLWHYEGVTSYYDDLFLLRAQIIDAAAYLDLLAEAATRLQKSPARLVHTLADASFETWIKYYQPDENSINASTNYYVKGALAALCLDLYLRLHTATTLDAVMQQLWFRYGREEIPAPERALEQMAQELSAFKHRKDLLQLSAFLDQLLRSTQELPLADLLHAFGVEAVLRTPLFEGDGGGKTTGSGLKATLGCSLKPDGSIAHVLSDSPAQLAGLMAGDVLVALDGLKLTAAHFQRSLDQLPTGKNFVLYFFRADELRTVNVALQPVAADTWTFSFDAAATQAAKTRRVAWLGA